MKLDLKLYRGYVNDEELVVFGHVFKSWAPDKYRMDRKGIRHAVSVIHMFRIKPLENVEIKLKFKEVEVTTKTLADGYFRFTIPYSEKLESGWHSYEVSCKIYNYGIVQTSELLKPFESKVGVISDIDDTFLVWHSGNFLKKLYVVLLKNINKRMVFEDVVPHYQALSRAGQENETASNSFFYVSSSEWNLYEFIVENLGDNITLNSGNLADTLIGNYKLTDTYPELEGSDYNILKVKDNAFITQNFFVSPNRIVAIASEAKTDSVCSDS